MTTPQEHIENLTYALEEALIRQARLADTLSEVVNARLPVVNKEAVLTTVADPIKRCGTMTGYSPRFVDDLLTKADRLVSQASA